MDYKEYVNPLCTRYSSKRMRELFGDENRIGLWRKLWIALAESERELGLGITEEQIAELKANADNINFDIAAERERIVRHDVMSHVYAYGEQCPSAKGIIHLGATSCYVCDNADLIIYHDGLKYISAKLLNVLDRLSQFAVKYKSLPTLGFTHLQPAQPVTVGKRACLWLQDILIDYEDLQTFISSYKLRGAKGTTGTQASYYQLFEGDADKVFELDKLVVKKMGFEESFAVTSQTYPRKVDYKILSLLSSIAQSCYKFANDIRILQNMKEIEEPFEKSQIGSSAMAYKRNPMRSERICSLARLVLSLPINAAVTAGTQWFERTLDDSANKRIVMADAFLAVDAILELMINVTSGLVVNEKVIEKHLNEELPFMSTEVILMECVKAGGDRQVLHERIRELSQIAAAEVKKYGKQNNLVELIKNDSAFAPVHATIDTILDARNFIGMAEYQTDNFITTYIKPLLDANTDELNLIVNINV